MLENWCYVYLQTCPKLLMLHVINNIGGWLCEDVLIKVHAHLNVELLVLSFC